MSDETAFEKAIGFINGLGIETCFQALEEETCFLPGLLIEKGRILIDREKLQHPGDVLHEAAHLAVLPAAERAMLDGKSLKNRSDAAAEEMMAIAWSYAACIHLELDPAFVFHPQGYQGGGAAIVENFREGRYIGVPVLQWLGMTTANGDGHPLYPAMIKWLRE